MTDHQTPFDQLVAGVVKPGLCTHCGTCAGLSGGALAMVETDYGPLPAPAGDQPVTLPDDILSCCPGHRIDYPGLNKAVFGHLPDSWLSGNIHRIYLGYSALPDIRREGASGGVITQVLVDLLEQGQIDGAVVVRQGSPRAWEAEPVIATTAEEIRACSQSVYRPVPVNALLDQMAAFEGRLAYVGLPDQVASLRKLQQIGHSGALKVDFVLGPYTGTNNYFGAIESFLRSNGVKSVEQITRLRYRDGEWPGHLSITLQDGRTLKAEKFHYNYLIPFYVTRATLFSVDFTNELTDISVGDAWSPRYEGLGEGFSVVIARTEKGEQVLRSEQERGLLVLEPLEAADAFSMHGHMLDFKKRGSFIRIGWRRALGRPVPDYGYHPRHLPLTRKLVEVVISGLFAIGRTRLARFAVRLIPIKILGPLFNTLRKTWKNLSKPVKRKGLGQYEIVLTGIDQNHHLEKNTQ
ncbi:MAG: Coenzyme F420 hydrogenase/dehydrogenase, beta subunit C-terminal domain [Anaerolineae bacterium]|nr:Coenzyme F420 hydrogenase/dehydrogenase, beta subunit C-terminal domain [Anaerolineae bacterium]